jgi:hypothetical protein
MAHTSDKSEITPDQKTVARFFTEKRQIAWVLLGMTMLWGVYGYFLMPKRKEPGICATLRSHDLPLAWFERRTHRATRHAQDRREDWAKRQSRKDRIGFAHRRRGCLRRAQ